MNKVPFLSLSAALALMAGAAEAQMPNYHNPFDAFFDAMALNPVRIESRQFMEPKMDMADLGDKIEVKAELPGIDEKDVNLSIEDGILTLSGERKQEMTEQNKNYYLRETSAGAFSRSIRLPKNIDESKISAVFKKGVLTVIIPKIEVKEENAKKIPIKSED
jgi:HSP20 family protein